MNNDPYPVADFLEAREIEKQEPDGTLPVVTISRQVGALGEEVAQRTAEFLTNISQKKCPWIVVDRDMGERVIADHHLPSRISHFFSGEQRISVDNYVDTLWGLSVPGDVMIRSLTKTMIELARIGHVVLVGRAAHIITAGFPRAAHVRVIGSLDQRVKRVAVSKEYSLNEASTEIKTIEGRRRHFVSTYFHADLEDASRYDIILNTDRLSVDDCAHSIAELVLNSRFGEGEASKLRQLRHQVLGPT